MNNMGTTSMVFQVELSINLGDPLKLVELMHHSATFLNFLFSKQKRINQGKQ